MKSPMLLILTVIAVMSFQVQAREAQTLYNQSCIACHASGAAGAPKKGDSAAWAPRLAQGSDILLKHTKQGINAMPPKGMCMDCTDDEFKALIQYMSSAK